MGIDPAVRGNPVPVRLRQGGGRRAAWREGSAFRVMRLGSLERRKRLPGMTAGRESPRRRRW